MHNYSAAAFVDIVQDHTKPPRRLRRRATPDLSLDSGGRGLFSVPESVSITTEFLGHILRPKSSATRRFHWYGTVLPVSADIRVIRIDGPKSISIGQPFSLKCNVRARADKIITLSWSKDGHEFYRYQPQDKRNASLAFKMNGVSVDVS